MIILLNEFLLHRVDRSQIKFLVPDWLSFSFFVCYTFRFCCRFVFFFFLIFFFVHNVQKFLQSHGAVYMKQRCLQFCLI